jgi:tRNA A37 threonylcarbamoyladenosine synthetase subunit TsaC/SUA5/YrdC
VYGIAADANNPKAMERLCAVKQRTEGKKFSILVAQRGIVENYANYTKPNLYKLIDKYWHSVRGWFALEYTSVSNF